MLDIVRPVWRTPTRGAAKPWKPSGWETSVRGWELDNLWFFSLLTTILPIKTTPVLAVQKLTPKMESIRIQSRLICLSGRLGPRFGV